MRLVDNSTIQGPPLRLSGDVYAILIDIPSPPVDISTTSRSTTHKLGFALILLEKTPPMAPYSTSFEALDLLVHHTLERSKEDHPPLEKPST